MTLIAGYISTNGVLLGADSGYNKTSTDIDEEKITDKIQQADETVVVAGAGYHRYMYYIQSGLVEQIDSETSLERINELVVELAEEVIEVAKDENRIEEANLSSTAISIWIAGVRPKTSGGFISKLDFDLMGSKQDLETEVAEIPGTYAISPGADGERLRQFAAKYHDKIIDSKPVFTFGQWFTKMIEISEGAEFPAQMCFITQNNYHCEYYSGVDKRTSVFNTLTF